MNMNGSGNCAQENVMSSLMSYFFGADGDDALGSDANIIGHEDEDMPMIPPENDHEMERGGEIQFGAEERYYDFLPPLPQDFVMPQRDRAFSWDVSFEETIDGEKVQTAISVVESFDYESDLLSSSTEPLVIRTGRAGNVSGQKRGLKTEPNASSASSCKKSRSNTPMKKKDSMNGKPPLPKAAGRNSASMAKFKAEVAADVAAQREAENNEFFGASIEEYSLTDQQTLQNTAANKALAEALIHCEDGIIKHENGGGRNISWGANVAGNVQVIGGHSVNTPPASGSKKSSSRIGGGKNKIAVAPAIKNGPMPGTAAAAIASAAAAAAAAAAVDQDIDYNSSTPISQPEFQSNPSSVSLAEFAALPTHPVQTNYLHNKPIVGAVGHVANSLTTITPSTPCTVPTIPPPLSSSKPLNAATAATVTAVLNNGEGLSTMAAATLIAQESGCTEAEAVMLLIGRDGRVGAYTKIERQDKIEKFRERKRTRIWRKQIKYDCRKRLADTRPRVKGRFVSRKGELDNNVPVINQAATPAGISSNCPSTPMMMDTDPSMRIHTI